MKKVNRYTRAGVDGKIISCPNCNAKTVVYNFAWTDLVCRTCKKDIPKAKWNVVK